VSTRADRTAELAQRIAEVRVTGSGAAGAVEVTVAGSGIITDLRLTQRACNLRPALLAEEILAAMRRAQARLPERAATIAAGTAGADTETGRAAVAGFGDRFPHPEGGRG